MWEKYRFGTPDALTKYCFRTNFGKDGYTDESVLGRKLTELDPNGLQTTAAGNTVSVCAGLLAEIVFTCVFVLVVLGATSKTNGATNNFAGLAIGLTLVLVHLVCIRYTGTSVNPARSIGPALFAGGDALCQLWIFIVGPFVGAILSALIWKVIAPKED